MEYWQPTNPRDNNPGAKHFSLFLFQGQKHAKLEKADILELTVTYLQTVKKSDEQKFIEGFEVNICIKHCFQFFISVFYAKLDIDSISRN